MSSYWDGVLRQRVNRRRVLAGAGAAGAAAFLAACGGDGAARRDAGDEPRTGGALKVAIASEPTNIDPTSGASGAEHQYFFAIYDPLVNYDQKGQLHAASSLAESWELPEPTRVVFKLRSGVKFQDGSDFTAEDVKWNMERSTTAGATPRADLAAIDSTQAVSRNEAVIRLKGPSAPLLTNLGDRGGQISSRTAFEARGGDAFKRNPVGTGQFVVKEWVSDAHIVFERNANYWRKDAQGRQLPYLQQIRYEVIPDAAVRVAALETGQVDLSTVPSADLPRVKADTRLQSVNFVGSGTTLWYINHEFPPLDNVWFRRAFASALDRQTYIRNFLTGDEPLATGMLTPASWGHDPNVKNYTYDVAKVREYLQRSGLPQSQWRVRAQPFDATMSQAEEFWSESVRQAGITIDWARGERDGWRTKVLKGLGGDGSAGMYFSGWSLRVDPDGNIGQFYLKNAAYNSGQAAVPEVEPLVIKARETYDLNERKKLYSEIQQKAVDNVYSHVLHHYSIAQIFARRAVGNLSAYYGGEGKPRYANLWV